MKGRLPLSLTVELLKHMSEEGRFEQTLSEFPDFKLQEIRETFAWLAGQIGTYAEGQGRVQQKIVRDFKRSPLVSAETKRVLSQLSPEEGCALLRNFGALEDV